MLSQLNLDSSVLPDDLNKSDFSQWHSIACFYRKIIPAKTQHKTHDTELLVIVEVFKTWRHYLKGCKYEAFILTNQNNLQQFINIKSLSFCQVRWAQELSRYYFRIDY